MALLYSLVRSLRTHGAPLMEYAGGQQRHLDPSSSCRTSARAIRDSSLGSTDRLHAQIPCDPGLAGLDAMLFAELENANGVDDGTYVERFVREWQRRLRKAQRRGNEDVRDAGRGSGGQERGGQAVGRAGRIDDGGRRGAASLAVARRPVDLGGLQQ